MAVLYELEEALEKWIPNLKKTETEVISIDMARGRYLAETLNAPFSQPPFPRSAVDGYAIKFTDIQDASLNNPVKLKIVDRIYAGDSPTVEGKHGEAIQIMTGTPIPNGSDCVIMQEHVLEEYETITVTKSLKFMQNICPMGEDYEVGEVLVESDIRLEPAALGLIASAGFKSVMVYKKPIVTLINTGSELINIGDTPQLGKIYNSNGHHLRGLIEENGGFCKVPIVGYDDLEGLTNIITEACQNSDLVITTGGVSVGKKDLMPIVLKNLGADIMFHRLALKPGTPALAAHYLKTPLICLSGNPLAAYITHHLIGSPTIHGMMSDKPMKRKRVKLELADDYPKKSPTRRFMAAKLSVGEEGQLQAGIIGGVQGSGRLCGALDCEAIIDLPVASPAINAGTKVEVIMLK